MSHLMTLLHIVKQLCRCCAGHCCRCCNVMQLLPCRTVVLVVRHIAGGALAADVVMLHRWHTGFEGAARLLAALATEL